MKPKAFISKSIKALVWFGGFFLPVQKNKVVCSSFHERGYSDNPKYIVEELKTQKKYKIIWLLDDMSLSETLPPEIIPCKSESLTAIYHLVTAAVWIDNCRKKFRYKKRKTLYIQTWHGGGGGKKCEKDVIEKLDDIYVNRAIKDAKNTDIMIAADYFTGMLYKKSFWFNGIVARIGYPRNVPILSNDKKDICKRVKEYFGIDHDKGILLYAPTFRKEDEEFLKEIDFSRLLNSFSEVMQKEYVIITHMHVNIKSEGKKLDYEINKVINGNTYTDMQELLVAADFLITDYSSVAYDFALMKKPVFRFLPDLKAYQADRDMYFDINEYPYPFAENNDELEGIIRNFDYLTYLKNLEVYLDKVGAIYNENAAKRVAEYIVEYTENGLNKKKLFEKYASDFARSDLYLNKNNERKM
ncbi:MAG: CDP-glycerol glycerophosphotransferase family protein [Lachnospiraceae bacterium]|nr:CDP-glycerol glycerophosphotransferase family protein [Lachnospiraceae bacterium]